MEADIAVRRGFVDVAEGQVHYRSAGSASDSPPLVMFHASPGSSKMLEPLIRAMAVDRRVVAPDTLGNGDSSPPPGDAEPDVACFADAHLRALDALGIGRFDAYGTHTGANIAVELAIAHPDRVRRLILDGVSNYSDAEREDMLAHHAPAIVIDDHGCYLDWIWHFVRDGYLFFPWYRRDAAHRRDVGVPGADVLYDKALEVLKAARTYHLSYRAAIAYPKSRQLPRVQVPTLLACAENDMLLQYLEPVASLLPAARTAITPGVSTPQALARTAAAFRAFLA